MALDSTIPQSRRAILTAALGGVAGLVAGALGRPSAAEAAIGDPLKLGKSSTVNSAGTAGTGMKSNSTANALTVTQNGTGGALKGVATKGVAVGVLGQNTGPASTGAGVKGIGGQNDGVYAQTANVNRYGVHGINTAALGDGVRGDAGTGGSGVIGFGPGGNGVYGQTDSGYGIHGVADGGVAVKGQSTTGIGLQGVSTSGLAAELFGPVHLTQYLQIDEMTAPSNPSANTARLFVRDNGGKTELCVIFPTGSIQVIKTEA